jgi:spore maturation protein CgeB
MKILYIGNSDINGYSYYQYKIIKNIFKNVTLLDLDKTFGKYNKIANAIAWKISPFFFSYFFLKYLKKKINIKFDIVYIHNVHWIDKSIFFFLKKFSKKIILYCPDNPFVSRDGNRWAILKPVLKYFDLVIFMQKNRLSHAKKFGIKKSIFIPPTIKFNQFYKNKISILDKKKYSTDIVLIATWFKERGMLVKDILDSGLKIKVYGSKWAEDKNLKKIQHAVSPGVNHTEYKKIIQNARIAICLPSEENQDDITHRSLEIPALGSLLLAKKTKTHSEFFIDNKEAVFFKNNKDCINKCRFLLQHEKIRKKIAKNGRLRIFKNRKKILFEYKIKYIFNKILNIA